MTDWRPIGLSKPRPPSETFAYHEYTLRAERPSRFAPGKVVDDAANSRTVCPRCGSQGPLLDHGQSTACGGCNLHMVLFGNGLTVWEGDDD